MTPMQLKVAFRPYAQNYFASHDRMKMIPAVDPADRTHKKTLSETSSVFQLMAGLFPIVQFADCNTARHLFSLVPSAHPRPALVGNLPNVTQRPAAAHIPYVDVLCADATAAPEDLERAACCCHNFCMLPTIDENDVLLMEDSGFPFLFDSRPPNLEIPEIISLHHGGKVTYDFYENSSKDRSNKNLEVASSKDPRGLHFFFEKSPRQFLAEFCAPENHWRSLARTAPTC